MNNILLQKFAQVTQGINDLYVAGGDLEHDINRLSVRAVTISAIVLVVLTLTAALLKDHVAKLKLPIFLMMSFTMAFSFLLLAGTTVYLNIKADSGGPVHWHADMEYWVCGNQIELKNPTGTLSNKIGTSVLHEHDDERIHLEGVVVDETKDASLGKFMHVIDGAITDEALVMPVNAEGQGELFEDLVDGDGKPNNNANQLNDLLVKEGENRFVRAIDGQKCGDKEADVQVFVYRFNQEDKTYTQSKITRPQDFVIFEDPNVPPGDCIIFEFSETKPFTDKLCNQYGIRDKDKCEKFGVEADKREICENTDVTDYEKLQADFDADGRDQSTSSDAQDQPANNKDNEPSGSTSTAASDLEKICEPFLDDKGNLTGIEMAAFKSDGTLLNPEVDCADYAAKLKDQAQSTTEETAETAPEVPESTGGQQ